MNSPDPAKLDVFMGKMLGDLGAAASGALVLLGDRLGLFKALAHAGPMTPKQLAEKTGTNERYIREWLNGQAAAGYVTFNPIMQTYEMTDEQAFVLANDQSPAFMCGAFEVIESMFRDEHKVSAAFRNGNGVGWHEHSDCLFRGTERFFRAGYAANLVSSWLPALEGVVDKLNRGAKVADVGCGHGASTILMAKAFPKSQFIGFDYHAHSIDRATRATRDANLETNCRFETASAKDFRGDHYDLVTCFDCLHDMGDPAGAAKHIYSTLASDGTWMIVEPYAEDSAESNHNPVGRIYYAASTMICVPHSMSQEVATALGAQAGEKRLREVVESGGFTRFRRATQTPFNLILEARK
jgi:2-polyprenyl-3-methyl-5-hydroxy-6-metoxy-1,4-benzoquinol methylase